MTDTVIKDFIKIMGWFGLFNESRWNKTRYIYTFRNGSTIRFLSLDKDDVGKGFRPYGFYCNEVNKCTFEAYNHFASRAKVVIVDYNPDAPFFIDDEVIPREDCETLQLTFEDNEELDIIERTEILGYLQRGYKDITLPEGNAPGQRYHTDNVKNAYWANKWQVYGLGNIGALIGAIFSNWQIVQDIPTGAVLRSGGGDFGFTNDPTAVIAVYLWTDVHGVYGPKGKHYKVLDEEIYETGLLNSDIAEKVRKSALAMKKIYWDSNEQKSIKELRKTHRLKAISIGAKDVNYGIDLMQEQDYLVTARSTNLISNFRFYVWDTDRNGKPINKPKKKNDHGLDAVRYEETGHAKHPGKYTVR
jgi:phage terminase large subunit